MSQKKTDRRGFLKGLGALSAAAVASFPVREAVRGAIDDISTIDDAPPERVPQVGDRLDLHAADGYRCSQCNTEYTPIGASVVKTTYGGMEGDEHVFLLVMSRYCSGCGHGINKLIHPSPIFIEERNDPSV